MVGGGLRVKGRAGRMGVASAPVGETCLSEAAGLLWGSVWAQVSEL